MTDRLREEEMELALYKAMEGFLDSDVFDCYFVIGNDTAMQMRNAAISVLYAIKESQEYIKRADL